MNMLDYSLNEGFLDYIFEKIGNFVLPSEKNNYRSKFLQSKILFCIVVLLFVLKIGTVVMTVNFPHNIFFADITESTLNVLVNQTRESAGLQPLTENVKLDEAAKLKAENMVQNQYFNHVSPTGITPWYSVRLF